MNVKALRAAEKLVVGKKGVLSAGKEINLHTAEKQLREIHIQLTNRLNKKPKKLSDIQVLKKIKRAAKTARVKHIQVVQAKKRIEKLRSSR